MDVIQDLRRKGTIADYQALVDRIPYARFLGMTIVPFGEGAFLLKLRFQPTLVGNPSLPAIHGGVVGALLETAAVLRLVWESEGDRLPKPIDLTIDYLRSAGPRDTYARAVITKHGRRVANVRAEAWQESPEKPVAAAHGHFLLPRTDGSTAPSRASG